jgi:nitrogen fixation NifU-like protein
MSDTPYTQALLRLAADGTGAGRLVKADASATVHNPACGDRVTIDLAVKDSRVAALAHHTRACILTQASAAILGAQAIGASQTDLAALAESVQAMLRGAAPPLPPFEAYGVFEGIADHPGRHVCVLLPLQAALEAFEVLELPEPGR